jgi:hypothetical protein
MAGEFRNHADRGSKTGRNLAVDFAEILGDKRPQIRRRVFEFVAGRERDVGSGGGITQGRSPRSVEMLRHCADWLLPGQGGGLRPNAPLASRTGEEIFKSSAQSTCPAKIGLPARDLVLC